MERHQDYQRVHVEYTPKPEVAEALRHYREFFVNRDDTYSRQRDHSRLYYRVQKPLDDRTLIQHFQGKITVGLYSIDKEGKTKWNAIDSDEGIEPLTNVQEQLKAIEMPSYLELSRKGGHLWIFWSKPIDSYVSKKILSPFSGNLEVYPSGDIPDEEIGLAIRGPLGIHRVNGQRYPFTDDRLRPVSEGVVRGQLDWLYSNVERVDPVPYIAMMPAEAESQAEIMRHVHLSESSPIAEWVARHDIADVVGRYVNLSRSGLGHCPWGNKHKHNDRHPSFAIFRRSQKFWCFTERVGGNAFDFLSRYYSLNPQNMLRELRNGDA